MKINKLIKKTVAFLDSDKRDRKEKKKYLKQVLRKLSKHEKRLKTRLQDTSAGGDKAKIKKKLALVHAQREKGMRLLRELKE